MPITKKPAAKKPATKVVISNAVHDQMTKTLKAAAKKAPAKPSKPAKKVAKAQDGETKAMKARVIFKRMKGKSRKEVLLAFVSEAGLTIAGAATYFSNIRKEIADE
jgi:hypothetical protein